MNVRMEDRKEMTLVGREGYGDSARGGEWVPKLWQALQEHMTEIAPIVKHGENGAPAGIWGAMSDAGRRFLPWESDGLYLAGCEVEDNAVTPSGWTKWVIPAYRYIVVECTPQTSGIVFQQMIIHYLPDNGFNLAGAVHERYLNDRMELYFPIAKL